jgi:hypothetical protein
MEGNPESLNDLTAGQAEDRFYQWVILLLYAFIIECLCCRLVSSTHMSCGELQRLGNLGDGGWDLCFADPFALKPGCIVYSFG